MAMTEEVGWQTKLQGLVERTAFIFNNELLSDVKFVVPFSPSEIELRAKVIPAHKFVLAVSSPVFFAMFYGRMAETKDSIELTDCDYESLLELFRFLYSDKVNLRESNVMQVLYLANKYMVPSLAEKCSEYLRDNLTASNAFSILTLAHKFEDKNLEYRCWKVIEKQTEKTVRGDEFVTVDRSVVESVVKKEVLNVTEVELFKAVDHWATKECERQGLTVNGESKRRILGEEIIRAIRFPLMSLKEFESVALDSNILTIDEVRDIMNYFKGALKLPLPFMDSARIHFRCNRFPKFNVPAGSGWYHSGAYSVNFTINKPLKLLGVEQFGSEDGEYTVSTEVKDTAHNSCLGKVSGTYTSVKDDTDIYFGFDVMFNRPVCLEGNKQYTLVSVVKGPVSWYGEEGQLSVESGGVQFTFSKCTFKNDNGHSSVTSGQFPAFIYS